MSDEVIGDSWAVIILRDASLGVLMVLWSYGERWNTQVYDGASTSP